MKYLFIFLTLSMFSCKSDHKQKQIDLNQPFPLNKGNLWVYEANIKYHQKETDSLIQEKIEWTMEVIDTIHHGTYIAAIVKGFPTDLVWYEGNAKRGDYALLQDSNKVYLIISDSINSIIARLHNLKDSLTDLRNSQEILFDFPLTQHKTWGADPEMPQRADSMYAWVVKRGASDSSAAAIQYMTNPDHSIFQFQPYIGITGYYFEHHGTVMELNMNLIRQTLH